MGSSRIRSMFPLDAKGAPAFEAPDIDNLFRGYARMIASLGLAMLGRNDEAEDLVQDVFVRAWRGLDKLKHPEAVKTWLMTIAVRVAHARLARRRFTRLFLPLGTVNIEQIAAPETSPEERITLQRLYGILENLPVDLRIAWVLRHMQSETVEDVAALCGWSLSTAKRRIAAAQRRVLRKMQPESASSHL